MTAPTHLVPVLSDRGFQHLPAVQDTYSGKIRVYEASTAFSPHIWLDIAGGALDDNAGTAHLTIDQARQIADQLNWLADHHYQVTP